MLGTDSTGKSSSIWRARSPLLLIVMTFFTTSSLSIFVTTRLPSTFERRNMSRRGTGRLTGSGLALLPDWVEQKERRPSAFSWPKRFSTWSNEFET